MRHRGEDGWGVVAMMVGVLLAGKTLSTRRLPAAKRKDVEVKECGKESKKDGIRIDVVIEEDFLANTLSARGILRVVPLQDHVGEVA